MSRVQPRGEISPFAAMIVAFLVLAVSGLSVWHFVLRDSASAFAVPASQVSAPSSPDQNSGAR